LAERFVRQEYKCLDVAGKVVIDIGANIGDSAIYFARRGAVHVYAYEPFRELCETAAANVSLNGCNTRVTLICAGVGRRDEEMSATYDASQALVLSTVWPPAFRTELLTRPQTQRVHVVSLSRALRQATASHPNGSVVCKIDCEGCEWALFAGEDIGGSLEAVEQIFMEFHHGRPDGLRGQLEDLGFATQLWFQEGRGDRMAGHLVATREMQGRTAQPS
jgi:FkbM family methyltransferase